MSLRAACFGKLCCNVRSYCRMAVQGTMFQASYGCDVIRIAAAFQTCFSVMTLLIISDGSAQMFIEKPVKLMELSFVEDPSIAARQRARPKPTAGNRIDN